VHRVDDFWVGGNPIFKIALLMHNFPKMWGKGQGGREAKIIRGCPPPTTPHAHVWADRSKCQNTSLMGLF
jgi:hypothetical protein